MGFLKKVALAAFAVTLTLAIGACAKQEEPPAQQEQSGQEAENAQQPEKQEENEPENAPAEAAEGTEYTNGANTFSIKLAGDFKQETNTNPDHIVLDNADYTLTVMVQAIDKEAIKQSEKVESFDQYIEFYKTVAIANLVKISQVTALDFSADNVVNAKADEFVAEQNGQVSKATIAYLETEKKYYTFTITGIQTLYDENIQELMKSINTLTEK